MQEYFVKLLGRYHSFIKEDKDEGSVLGLEADGHGVRPAETEHNMIRWLTTHDLNL